MGQSSKSHVIPSIGETICMAVPEWTRCGVEVRLTWRRHRAEQSDTVFQPTQPTIREYAESCIPQVMIMTHTLTKRTLRTH